VIGQALRRSAAFAAIVVALMAVAAPSSLASPGDQSGAYQQDATHDGYISNAGLAAPLTQNYVGTHTRWRGFRVG
jgi:hypothetical protein